MHMQLFVTLNRHGLATSADARTRVSCTLLDDPTFAGEGGRFAAPVCEWFVIGGRWSGALSRATWAHAVTAQIAALEEENDIHVSGMFYADKVTERKQRQLKERVEALYASALPPAYAAKGLVYDRDTYAHLGYDDDAMLVDGALYTALLAPYEGKAHAPDAWEDVEFFDLDEDAVSRAFIGEKWLVVVDYHV